MAYEVIVGNAGTVYKGDNERDALLNARLYVDQSKANRGRAAGEPVTVLKDGEIVEHYEPPGCPHDHVVEGVDENGELAEPAFDICVDCGERID